jgi:hypothetical protein
MTLHKCTCACVKFGTVTHYKREYKHSTNLYVKNTMYISVSFSEDF